MIREEAFTRNLLSFYKISIRWSFYNSCVKKKPTLYADVKQKRRTEIKIMAIPTGQVTLTLDNMFQGIRLNKQVVAIVDSVAVAGTYSTSPFNFKNYELNRIGLYIDNIPIGGNPLRLNFDKSSRKTILPAFSCTVPIRPNLFLIIN